VPLQEKPQTPPVKTPAAGAPPTSTAGGARTAAAAARPAGVPPSVQDGLRDAARNLARDALLERRPYLKMAFANPYNLSLFLGGLTASAVTLNPFLALATLGVEALWLLHAPDSRRLRHLLWDPRFAKLKEALEAEERARRLSGLDPEVRARVEALVARRREIRQLAEQNPSFAGDLLRGELVKTDQLVDAFVDMAVTCARYQSYLSTVDEAELERARKRYELQAQRDTSGGAQGDIARKNLAILEKRAQKMVEIRKYLDVANGQLDLIENSFELISDQIVTMQSPQELSGQLDELLDGVEAIRETARDTEQFLSTLDKDL
jgi:hypothetical protein